MKKGKKTNGRAPRARGRDSSHSEYRYDDLFAVPEGGFVGADPGRRDVGAEDLVDTRSAPAKRAGHEFMHQMRVGSVVPAARACFQGFLRVQGIEIATPATRIGNAQRS